MRVWLALWMGWLAPNVAFAGACDIHVKKASSARGADLVAAYRDLLRCDKATAEGNFDAFMKASGDVGTLVDLSLTAIDAKAYTPVWNMMEKIPDYDARDEVAKGVGANCDTHTEVVPFLQGAYFGLRDVSFGQWDDALVTCESGAHGKWVEDLVQKPPKSSYDEKYATLVTAYVKRKHEGALPVLERAAIEAANNGGPFSMIIEKMEAAVTPDEIGATIGDEGRKKLEKTLANVANAVGPEQAALVADRLFNAGAEAAAASLLPRVYPDRVQSGGRLMYGIASIETCEKEMVVHYASVIEPSKRWSIVADIEGPARAFKAKLKCTSGQPWEVLATGEPVANANAIASWVDDLVKQYEGKGLAVKTKEEKQIVLQ